MKFKGLGIVGPTGTAVECLEICFYGERKARPKSARLTTSENRSSTIALRNTGAQCRLDLEVPAVIANQCLAMVCDDPPGFAGRFGAHLNWPSSRRAAPF